MSVDGVRVRVVKNNSQVDITEIILNYLTVSDRLDAKLSGYDRSASQPELGKCLVYISFARKLLYIM